jgi:exodeoxyribonuclease V alpha subunit
VRVSDASDPHDARRVRNAPQPLRAFNDAGVLAAADVHVALRLAAIAGGETDATVGLAIALAVRGPRLGHVYVDLAAVAEQATVDLDEPVDLSALPWPEPGAWAIALLRSPLVACGEEDDAPGRPLRLIGTRLYLDRYWREERQVAADLLALASDDAAGATTALGSPAAGSAIATGAGEGARVGGGAGAPDAAAAALADGLRRLFGGDADDRQRAAAATAAARRLTVVAGGPGTGKTTTVARILALLAEQAAIAGRPPALVALAAPTGKAAARLEEAVHAEARVLDVAEDVRAQLLGLEGLTLHRLLGWRPGSHSRFRHDRANRLPHDVVVVDETSMVSLSLMARLVEAVRPGARLVLVGDPGQLTSIEAGAVLGDIVGPAGHGDAPPSSARLGVPPGPDAAAAPRPAIAGGIVVLDRSHRFGPGIAALARAVRAGDADATVRALREHRGEVTWLEVDAAAQPDALATVREGAIVTGRAVWEHAAAGDAPAALAATGAFRVLCAHRRGEHGAATWRAHVEAWLAGAIDGFASGGEWYVGRPVLVTENDYGLRLYNGDTGVVVTGPDGRPGAAFERHAGLVSPARLEAVETVYAMTIHKAQGSQFHTAVVLLPPATSPILTRELLYTGVTRARTRLVVAGTEAAVRAAVHRPVARASGLRARLWGDE